MTNAANTTTETLFSRTHEAMKWGEWSVARAGLENLARSNNARQLDPRDYPKLAELRGEYRELIMDRLELANSAAERNAQ